MPIDWSAPLPKHDTEQFQLLREQGVCPVICLDWYRMPQLFNLGVKLFGRAFLNFKGRSRRSVDKQLKHACRVWQEKYLASCSPERQATCVDILERAFESAHTFHPDKPLPYLLTVIKSNINREETDAAQKAHVPDAQPIFDSVFKAV